MQIKKPNPIRRRNAAATALASPQFRKRVERVKNKYTRKGRKRKEE